MIKGVPFFISAALCVAISVSASDSLKNQKASDASGSATVKASAAGDSSTPAQLTLTLTELAQFNGADGKSAYVAIDGVIYDVTGVDAWKKGNHKGYKAGTDISELINKKSPHGKSVLKKRKVVGKIVAAPEKK